MSIVELRVDVTGIPGHTFLVITDSDGVERGYGFYPAEKGSPESFGTIKDDLGHQYDRTTGKISMTEEESTQVANYINNSIENPPSYTLYFGSQYANWAVRGLVQAGIPSVLSPNMEPDNILRDILESITWNPYSQWINLRTRDLYNNLLEGIRNIFGAAKTIYSPIIIDLDGDGVETTGLKTGTYFDHDGNGFAEQTGWAKSDNGLLVLDRNSDGIINDGKELFGNQTLLSDGAQAANGFQALAELDTNADGKIEVNNVAYSQLKIWQDADGDGISSADELQSLSDLNIASINTGYSDSALVDANGNEHKQVGAFTKSDGTTSVATDVWFKTDKMYTIANEWLDVPEDIAALPDLQGYGNVYDLHQAVVRNELRRAA
jgi:hypothetical protein